MSLTPSNGCYYLKQGVRLIPAGGGATLLQENPLRALKINQAAFNLLKKCECGYRMDPATPAQEAKGTLDFLDLLRQSCILDWTPPFGRFFPFVSVIVPVYNRPDEIAECLTSLQKLDYPRDRIEIIVVDDASQDETVVVVKHFNALLIVQPHNRGQSAARNVGVAAARGEIIAFIDSDCIADPLWLRELIPYFQDSRVALAGGSVDSLYRNSRLDRYEASCSALNMGTKPLMGRGNHSTFYVPTCNMLVRKDAFEQLKGMDETLRLGEDVDFCWRLMGRGHHLAYTPGGKVKHRHRNQFLTAFPRRFAYGTSEAVLYKRFPQMIKYFPWQIGGITMILAFITALVTCSFQGVALAACLLAGESLYKRTRLKQKMDVQLGLGEIFFAVFRSHFLLAYCLSFYAVRYFLVLLVALSMLLPCFLPLWLAVIFLPTIVDYIHKKPKLSLPEFAFFYWTEHAFYQCGALWGSFRERSYRLYRMAFCPVGFLRRHPKRRENPGTVEKKVRTEGIG